VSTHAERYEEHAPAPRVDPPAVGDAVIGPPVVAERESGTPPDMRREMTLTIIVLAVGWTCYAAVGYGVYVAVSALV
jgi:hypothetical protein